MTLRKFATLGAVLIATTAGAAPQSAIEIPLKPYVEGLRLMEMTVDGQTGNFIFDTGGGLSTLTVEFSRALRLEPFGRLTGFRHTGEPLHIQRVQAQTVKLGGVASQQTELTVFDLTKLLKGAPVVEGLVALNSFEGAVLTIDFARNRLTLETGSSLEARTQDMAPLRIRAGRQSGGASLDVFVAVESPQGTLWLELDSGNAGPVLLSPHAADQLHLMIAGKTTAATLRLAPASDYSCSVAIKESIYDGLLNTAFFQQHIITLDLRDMRAWLKRNPL